jgi:lipopolysaccharide/colanic/teichoic acid biosynthesis glycosyltransferase
MTPLEIDSLDKASSTLVEEPPVVLSNTPINHRKTPHWKRLIDIVGALSMLVILSPLLLGLSLFIKLVSKGPILFRQTRLGVAGSPFTIYKFRTMHVVNEQYATEKHREYVAGLLQQNSPAEKPDLRSRLIPGASFLRSRSLDELPQLWNVLMGSMSLVGPRPEVLAREDYDPWQLRRFEVAPGITGLWQVSGKNQLSFNRMVELDIQYVDEQCPALDLLILAKTVGVVLGKTNV